MGNVNDEVTENKNGQNLTVGILAHVDAGKTTLAEALLYTCGQIRNLGRVDHKDAFLDNFALERDRGITIFSKQAHIEWNGRCITLLDTPGHVDFSAEMERTLQILDAAVLVISGTDGVQGHTRTLWKLLCRYNIPTFIFVNKMDRDEADREKILSGLQKELDHACVDMTDYFAESVSGGDSQSKDVHADICENIATCSENLMNEYLDTGDIAVDSIVEAVDERECFPCIFGSALKLDKIQELLDTVTELSAYNEYGDEFGARVYKITRDNSGNRITHMRITGGSLKAKQIVTNSSSALKTEDIWEEKADQIVILNGAKETPVLSVSAGDVCAVRGLKNTYAGQGLGTEQENMLPSMEPVLSYRMILPQDCDAKVMYASLRELEEEIPELSLVWNEALREIHVKVMGAVQTEILQSIIFERYGVDVSFGEPNIVYKETIAAPVVGIGHFEPLRHYAEVHLLMEPGERGSGLQFASLVSDDDLAKNWQRLVLTHLEEKSHKGVLTGSDITDMKIVLVAGRAHEKHTEGGDFRQATYRALRQGLMKAENMLLEPVFSFTLEVPTACVGRAMTDIKKMYGHFEGPINEGEMSILTGTAPVETMQGYQQTVTAYTGGMGRLNLVPDGYKACHNTEEVMEKAGYNPEADIDNPADSVFCSHGAGTIVDWREVDSYAHVESRLDIKGVTGAENVPGAGIRYEDYEDIQAEKTRMRGQNTVTGYITQEEIDEIFARTYGNKNTDNGRRRRFHKAHATVRSFSKDTSGVQGRMASPAASKSEKKEEYLLVDGYNIIFAWKELKELSEINIDSARDKLIDIMCNYQGYTGVTLILVFDAYKVKNNQGSEMKHNNIYVVYTKEAETADQYIEKTVHKIGHKYNVTVATSDRLEQMIIWGGGAMRMSAAGLKEAVDRAENQMRQDYDI
jgi:small GTP-binding protein